MSKLHIENTGGYWPVRGGVQVRVQGIKMGTLKRVISDLSQRESSEDRNAIK
jgi:hypothetical protein